MTVQITPLAGDSLIQQIDIARNILNENPKVSKVIVQMNDGLKTVERGMTDADIQEKVFFSYIN